MSALTLGVAPEDKRDETGDRESRRTIRSSRALKQGADVFHTFLTAVQSWILEYADRVSKVYLVAESDLMNLYVIARIKEYDFELRKKLTELVISLRDDGIAVQGMLIPDGEPDELRAFFDPQAALLLSTQ